MFFSLFLRFFRVPKGVESLTFQMVEQLVYLYFKVGSVVEDAEVCALAFLFLIHLLCHTGLDLLGGGLVALGGSLEP